MAVKENYNGREYEVDHQGYIMEEQQISLCDAEDACMTSVIIVGAHAALPITTPPSPPYPYPYRHKHTHEDRVAFAKSEKEGLVYVRFKMKYLGVNQRA